MWQTLGCRWTMENYVCTLHDEKEGRLRWLPPVLHFAEPLNFTKGILIHHDGLVLGGVTTASNFLIPVLPT